MPDPTRTEVQGAVEFLRNVRIGFHFDAAIDGERVVWGHHRDWHEIMSDSRIVAYAKQRGYSPQSGGTGDAHG